MIQKMGRRGCLEREGGGSFLLFCISHSSLFTRLALETILALQGGTDTSEGGISKNTDSTNRAKLESLAQFPQVVLMSQ